MWVRKQIRSRAFATILNLLTLFPEKNDFLYFPQNLDVLTFFVFLENYKNARAEVSRRMVRFSCRDLSYETDSGPKTKTGNRPFSRPLKKMNNFLRHPKRCWVTFYINHQLRGFEMPSSQKLWKNEQHKVSTYPKIPQ